MTTHDSEAPPTRGPQHDALEVFLGNWRATGTSYGLPVTFHEGVMLY